MTIGETMQWGLLALCASMLIMHGTLATGVLRVRRKDRYFKKNFPSNGWNPSEVTVSVIVAAMNEEDGLPRLLQSLARQTADFELVLVDDRSTDATLVLMEQYQETAPHSVKVINNRLSPQGVTGKQQALDLGVAASTGKLLIFTDGDCVVPPTWIESLTAHFLADKDSSVGVVFGQLKVASFDRENESFLQRYQAFGQPLVHQYSVGSAGVGKPSGCFGNNLAIRRQTLAQIGGFQALGFALVEDSSLIVATHRLGWKIRAVTTQDTKIITDAHLSWRAVFNQWLRWNSGAFFSANRRPAWSFRFLSLFLILSVVAAPCALLVPWLLLWPVTSFLSIGTLAALVATQDQNHRLRSLSRVIPYTLFFMVFYSIVVLMAIVGKRTDWKGSKLGGNANHQQGRKP